MAFRRVTGRTKTMHLPKRATLTIPIVIGDWLNLSDTGAAGLFRSISDTTSLYIPLFGVAREDVATTNTGTGAIAVEVPLENYVEWEFDTDSDNGLVASDVGGYRDLDTLGRNVNRDLATNKTFAITRFISASKGHAILLRGMLFRGGSLNST